MESDKFFYTTLIILLVCMSFLIGIQIAQSEEVIDDSKQLEGLYGQALNHKEAKVKVQLIESNPRMFLYYYGDSQGLQLWEVQTLDRIIMCESKWNTYAANPNSSAKGLAQFLDSSWAAWGEGSVYDPVENIKATVKYYKHSGTRPWVCKG